MLYLSRRKLKLNIKRMKIKTPGTGLLSGKIGDMVYYVVDGKQYVRRAAIPGKPRKTDKENMTAKQHGNLTRFAGVQRYYAFFRKKISEEIWKTAGESQHARAINLFHKTNGHCFNAKGKLVDLSTFKFAQGELLLPRNIAVVPDGDGFRVTWNEERNERNAAPGDRLCVGIIYSRYPDSPHLAVEIIGTRGDREGWFRPAKKYACATHAYCYWAREDGTAFSESVHFLLKMK